MNQGEFARAIKDAYAMQETTWSPQSDFWAGYLAGLRYSWHGVAFQRQSEHDRWMAMGGHGDPIADARALGYSCGYEAISVPEAQRFWEHHQRRTAWEAAHPDYIRGIRDAREEP